LDAAGSSATGPPRLCRVDGREDDAADPIRPAGDRVGKGEQLAPALAAGGGEEQRRPDPDPHRDPGDRGDEREADRNGDEDGQDRAARAGAAGDVGAPEGAGGDALGADPREQGDAGGDEREGHQGGAEVPPADALQSDRQGDREQAGGDAAGGADRPDLTATADDAGDDAPG
jgi:hypothetical protein